MDLVGFAVLGTVTGIGGGTLRDMLLDVPLFGTRQPAYLLTCVVVSVAVFFAAPVLQSRYGTYSGSMRLAWRASP